MTHAAAQLTGGRLNQCDATATFTYRKARAYVLLDGIGDSSKVREWTPTTARQLARTAAQCADAEAGLRTVHAHIADERASLGWRANDEPCAVAVVAVAIRGELLQIAWCGDARAYVLPSEGGELQRLTSDHNGRQRMLELGLTPDPYARNEVTSCLGDTDPHAQIGAAPGPAAGRLLLASDGAYEPLEDSARDLTDYLAGPPRWAARRLVKAAIDHASGRADNATALVADLS